MNENSVTLYIKGDVILEKKDGDELYIKVCKLLNSEKSVVLDFENAVLCNQDFLECFICGIYKSFEKGFLSDHFKIINFWQLNEKTLQDLIARKGH